jgi:hypothetical protein
MRGFLKMLYSGSNRRSRCGDEMIWRWCHILRGIALGNIDAIPLGCLKVVASLKQYSKIVIQGIPNVMMLIGLWYCTSSPQRGFILQ